MSAAATPAAPVAPAAAAMAASTGAAGSKPSMAGGRRSFTRRMMKKGMNAMRKMTRSMRKKGMMYGGKRRKMRGGAGAGSAAPAAAGSAAPMKGGAHKITVGSKLQVWHGTAAHTSGGLKKKDLMKHKGRIVSRKKHAAGKKAIKNLVKAGYKAKKGTFKLFRK